MNGKINVHGHFRHDQWKIPWYGYLHFVKYNTVLTAPVMEILGVSAGFCACRQWAPVDGKPPSCGQPQTRWQGSKHTASPACSFRRPVVTPPPSRRPPAKRHQQLPVSGVVWCRGPPGRDRGLHLVGAGPLLAGESSKTVVCERQQLSCPAHPPSAKQQNKLTTTRSILRKQQFLLPFSFFYLSIITTERDHPNTSRTPLVSPPRIISRAKQPRKEAS
ncbi:hypothetical protein B0H65DRAFT_185948 [Neurospora tetraspora]|uniref:Uncharacterized protein n=1 Tax=Neurospora tetraspora TaxID=94610 RepID=A0AAE0JEI8_9PEZI|nr:hypothetical protein B0H65DRAFT_185948 [Neurospora tetraspora]